MIHYVKIFDQSSNYRMYDLDALRAFMMLLGIVLHSAVSFLPIYGFFGT